MRRSHVADGCCTKWSMVSIKRNAKSRNFFFKKILLDYFDITVKEVNDMFEIWVNIINDPLFIWITIIFLIFIINIISL